MYRLWPKKGIHTENIEIIVNGRKISLLILKPKNSQEERPGILWIHGGGYMLGFKEMVYSSRAENLVIKFGAVVIAPNYRLSWMAPYPAAVEDCYEALKYIKDNAESLGIRKNQIMVGGESAGGGLCAAVCMMARDRKEVNVSYQMPLYPMIDNFDTETSVDNHAKVWNTFNNHIAWKLYLRKNVHKIVPEYAAPARCSDYSNLPPAYTFVCTAEPFYAETVRFVENLKNAGVEAKVDVYDGLYHAFDMVEPELAVSQEAARRFEDNFAYALEHYFAQN